MSAKAANSAQLAVGMVSRRVHLNCKIDVCVLYIDHWNISLVKLHKKRPTYLPLFCLCCMSSTNCYMKICYLLDSAVHSCARIFKIFLQQISSLNAVADIFVVTERYVQSYSTFKSKHSPPIIVCLHFLSTYSYFAVMISECNLSTLRRQLLVTIA